MYAGPFPLTTWKVLTVTNTARVKAGWDYVESVCTCVSLERSDWQNCGYKQSAGAHAPRKQTPKKVHVNEVHAKDKASFSRKLNTFCPVL